MTTQTETATADYNRYTRDPVVDDDGILTYSDPTVDQYPRRYTTQWNDPEWRLNWLGGISDEELDTMSHRERGARLPAYWMVNGIAHYGERAEHYILGSEILAEAGIRRQMTQHEIIALGSVVASMLEQRHG